MIKITHIKSIQDISDRKNIELAVVNDGHKSIVPKGKYSIGDSVVYIPENSIIPDWMIRVLNVQGKLQGKELNVVKPIKMCGFTSNGLLYPADQIDTDGEEYRVTNDVGDGFFGIEDDLSEWLGVKKYTPVVPEGLTYVGKHLLPNYLLDKYKDYKNFDEDMLFNGEDVVITEKIHGTFCGIACLKESEWDDKYIDNKFLIFSKGTRDQGCCYDKNVNNLYTQTVIDNKLIDAIDKFAKLGKYQDNVYFFIEIFGDTVQDLTYGLANQTYRLIDIGCIFEVYGEPVFHCIPWMIFCSHALYLQLPIVQELYKGKFSRDLVEQYTDGKETISGTEAHMREGVVIRSTGIRGKNMEMSGGFIGLKNHSKTYLSRDNGTEYN